MSGLTTLLTKFKPKKSEIEFENIKVEILPLTFTDQFEILEEIQEYQNFPDIYELKFKQYILARTIQTMNGLLCVADSETDTPVKDKDAYLRAQFAQWNLDIFNTLWMLTQAQLAVLNGKFIDKYKIENFLSPKELKLLDKANEILSLKEEQAN